MIITFITLFLLVCVQGKEVLYNRVDFNGPVIMNYTVSIPMVNVPSSKCGQLCTSIPGCKMFHYDSKSCFILQYPGTGSVNVTSFFGAENWRGVCYQRKETGGPGEKTRQLTEDTTELSNVDNAVHQFKAIISYFLNDCKITGYPVFGGKYCLRIVNDKRNWLDAKANCSQDGGQLLTMKSGDFYLKKVILEEHPYWIGGNDLAKEGDWRWNDGSEIEASLWLQDGPSNTYKHEHCLEVTAAVFNDYNCNAIRRFACEKLNI